MSSPLVEAAAAHARALHAGDVRKGTGCSYFEAHLVPVAELVAAHGGDDVQVAAAYLHDAVEDHGGARRLADLRRRFGHEVAAIVEDLSDSLVDTESGVPKAPWHDRKESYLASLPDKPIRSLEVAVADKCANAEALVADYRRLGDDLWSRFTTGSASDQRWYYEALTDTLGHRLPDHPLLHRVRRAVDELASMLDAR